ncbi:cobalt-precorrin-3B C(17)-methyltransferase [Methanobrevibacter cuticularis]|uniref:Cobalt-precorrin-3B C(17)-methyltransferase n=1 Tax=Methanobrevibacter cuticularis TaxID=47311 RepID=A0A166CKS3_9EURY|nr:precorrin-3B C(17)-methyltransferase [Methanobrevibacter cuticularis]KZX14614.1 cobalt-precorrin-3B C(17)-methyltransferase [Methanobrevibacter cuticularis]
MINIIGIGPNRENITISALKALEESDVVIGYKKYINSIADLIEKKEVFKKGMGDEIARGELAISKSLEGKNVALVSSGDPGVYGMANLMFQLIGKYDGIKLKVFPGVTSLNYSASLLGAPLHDFAAISLSDILTPLSEIEKKIEYAIKADFIIAIYNPISKTRKKPFKRFQEILNELKDPTTLIGIVDSTQNPSKTKIITLNQLDEDEINMSTTLIIGNSLTYEYDGYMITPRGYVVKAPIHPLANDFYTKYLDMETPTGLNKSCEYYPCHSDPQYCDFCYCPFYPCGDSSTGGKWIKNKNVWSCEDCEWIHEKNTIKCIKDSLPTILKNPEDLKSKKKELLKLRRHCILATR